MENYSSMQYSAKNWKPVCNIPQKATDESLSNHPEDASFRGETRVEGWFVQFFAEYCILDMKTERRYFIITKCCYCIPLRIGCFILGYISLVLNLLITLFFAGSIVIMAIFTHGFRYLHMRQTQAGDVVPYESASDRAKLHLAVSLVLLVGCLNLAWLMLNAFLLVGLHKRRPGPIKVHVAVATIRLILSVLGLLSVQTSKATIFCWIETCMSGYFIMIYYAYSQQLEQEKKAKANQPTQSTIADIVLSYANNINKKSLAENDGIKVLNV